MHRIYMTDAHTARSEKFLRKHAVLDVLTPSSIHHKRESNCPCQFSFIAHTTAC